jgi:hypothetical protein
MTQLCTTVALFADSLHAEAAVRALRQGSFDLRKLSIVGKNYHREEHVTGIIDRGDGARYWGRFGVLSSSLCGVPGGSALLLFPGIGQVVILGPLVNSASGALGRVGSSALCALLAPLGLSRDAAGRYEDAIRAGRFALLAQGTRGEADLACSLLQSAEAVELRQHLPADGHGPPPLHCIRHTGASSMPSCVREAR